MGEAEIERLQAIVSQDAEVMRTLFAEIGRLKEQVARDDEHYERRLRRDMESQLIAQPRDLDVLSGQRHVRGRRL